jgi:peptidoglycan/LPS O-acetylase OafA/YrhL
LLIFYVLVLHDHFSGWLGNLFSRLSSILGTRPFHWAGELSYSAYLIHLIIMQPVVAYVLTAGENLSALSRFLIVIAVVLPVTYTLSFITYTQIEKRGNALGARLLRRFDVRAKDAVMSPAEQIAAP